MPLSRRRFLAQSSLLTAASTLLPRTLRAQTGAPAGAATDRPATPAPGRVTFGIEPASASGADGRASFTFGVTPGAVLFDHVSLLNYSSVPLTLQVYARDAEETTGGGFGLLPASSTSRGVGAWISGPPGDAAVEVPPETAKGQPGQTVVPFTVQVSCQLPVASC